MLNILNQIEFILVRPSHPGNIGATARAMKNMGLTQLRLVAPSLFPHPDATARAAGADDVLSEAKIFQTLTDALAGSNYVIATSARARRLDWPVMTPREAAERVLERACAGRAAIVFGAERSGLSNEDLEQCNAAIAIPTDPSFSSLNLAAAVQIMAYEIWSRGAPRSPIPNSGDKDDLPVNHAKMEGLYEHLERALSHSGFFDSGNPEIVMRRLRRLFSRAALTQRELNILRGFCKSVLALRKPP